MNMEDGEVSEDEMEGHSGSSTSAAYMVINNRGRQADKLLSITSDAAESAEMHLSQTENDITSMKMVTEIMIPPKGKTELKPGSYHIMLIRLKHNLHPGDEVILKLHFEKSGEIEIAAEVREP